MKKLNLLVIPALAMVFASCGGNAVVEEIQNDFDTVTENIEEAVPDLPSISNDSKFVSKDGEYKIMFPGTPTHSEQMEPTVAGNIEIHMDMYEKSATEVYMVGYNDYPSSAIEGSDAENVINNGIEGAKGAMGTSIEDSRVSGTLNGYPCVTFTAKSPVTGYHVHYKVVLRNNRLYQAAILRDGAYPSEKAVESFIDGFELILDEEVAV